MAAKATGKTAPRKSSGRTKKSSSKKPAPKRAGAQPAAGNGVEALEQKVRAAEARAQQLERDAREAQERAQQLERELRAAQGALAAQQRSEREAGTASVAVLVDGVRRLRCPRCSGPMTEYQHQVVRADRCEGCHGIFFDNGELEQVVDKAMADRVGGKHGGWFLSLFGRREKST